MSACAVVAMVMLCVTKQQKQPISKLLCKCIENNRLQCVFCNSKLGYLATYGAISNFITTFGLAKCTVLKSKKQEISDTMEIRVMSIIT